MTPTQIAEGIYDVGVIDWNIRDFHGYSTDRGTTYNAYLILDEKVALIDTVKAPFADQLIGNIAQVIDPAKIDLVISNHTEMAPKTFPATFPRHGITIPSPKVKRCLWGNGRSPSWKPAWFIGRTACSPI